MRKGINSSVTEEDKTNVQALIVLAAVVVLATAAAAMPRSDDLTPASRWRQSVILTSGPSILLPVTVKSRASCPPVFKSEDLTATVLVASVFVVIIIVVVVDVAWSP